MRVEWLIECLSRPCSAGEVAGKACGDEESARQRQRTVEGRLEHHAQARPPQLHTTPFRRAAGARSMPSGCRSRGTAAPASSLLSIVSSHIWICRSTEYTNYLRLLSKVLLR